MHERLRERKCQTGHEDSLRGHATWMLVADWLSSVTQRKRTF
ncbi:hypothetical protein RMSM_03125 [Rhodopirellula maiorica SM1]|uniref:Uncharacterized protein n=1 Tax=Rhodopirellula maiorica SM1 TaxID=1265738 RepID=M5RL85_9BACT|nr:hypothetical protein RMSM_03125 [Rhodopirellula maiorica SM1]